MNNFACERILIIFYIRSIYEDMSIIFIPSRQLFELHIFVLHKQRPIRPLKWPFYLSSEKQDINELFFLLVLLAPESEKMTHLYLVFSDVIYNGFFSISTSIQEKI